jgi:sialic acid synthase SpsE
VRVGDVTSLVASGVAVDPWGQTVRMCAGPGAIEYHFVDRRYVAGPDGEFEADPDDVAALCRIGCTRAA